MPIVMNAVYVAPCDVGLGLFAGRDFGRNEEILRFSGAIISLDEVLAKGDKQCNPLQVGDMEYMDIGAPGVLANHSCQPNAGIINDRILIALRPILADEEIRYDYSTTMQEEIWTMPCVCGSERCRGVVGDFNDLPEDLRAEYLRLGLVQGFIVRGLAGIEAGAAAKTGGKQTTGGTTRYREKAAG